MKIITLTKNDYKNYADTNSKGNFGQTLEYSMLNFNSNKRKLFLGLVDDNDEIYAATLILIFNVSPGISKAIAPNGYLIDYANFELVKNFTAELVKYLKKEKVTFLITNPMFKYRVYNKDNIIIENNEALLNNLYSLNYKKTGYYSDFSKYDVIIENNNSINDIYKNFNRNTKRNINEGIKLSISLHRGDASNVADVYKIIEKKTKKSLLYYQNLMEVYSNKDNKMEVFFAKLNPHKYLINIKKAFDKERIRNEKLHRYLDSHRGHINDHMLNKKINSDNAMEKLNRELKYAVELDQKYDKDFIVGASIVIKNNHEIYFLIDGYKKEFKRIHSTHILKWAIIKKYYEYGYRIFNLGEIHKDYIDKSNKYHNQYLYKIGFGGNIVEYSPNLVLVINKPLYHLYNNLTVKK